MSYFAGESYRILKEMKDLLGPTMGEADMLHGILSV